MIVKDIYYETLIDSVLRKRNGNKFMDSAARIVSVSGVEAKLFYLLLFKHTCRIVMHLPLGL